MVNNMEELIKDIVSGKIKQNTQKTGSILL